MDVYVFMRTVGDWDKLYDLQRKGTIRSIARIAVGPHAAILSFPHKSPEHTVSTMDDICPQGLLNCVPGIGSNPLGPCKLIPQPVVFLVEVLIDLLHWERLLGVPDPGPDVHTRLLGTSYNGLLEFVGQDIVEVEHRALAFLAKEGVKDYRISVTGTGLMVGAGPVST